MSVNKGKKLTANFYEYEIECKCGCGFKGINPLHITRLQIARDIYRRFIRISSGCRCVKWNKHEGGGDDSSHVKGLATDIYCKYSRNRFFLVDALYKAGFKRIGIKGPFIHVDSDLKKEQHVLFLYKNQPDINGNRNGKT